MAWGPSRMWCLGAKAAAVWRNGKRRRLRTRFFMRGKEGRKETDQEEERQRQGNWPERKIWEDREPDDCKGEDEAAAAHAARRAAEAEPNENALDGQ